MQLLVESGPFFAISLHAAPPAAPWRPLAELPGSAELLDWIARVRVSLGSDLRVAASVAQLGLVARLLSPVLAAAARHRVLLDLCSGYWQPPLTSTFALSLPEPPRGGVPADALAHVVSGGPIAELTMAMGRLGSVSSRVLAGNLASAVNGAALQLGPAAAPLAATMLAAIPDEDDRPGPAFRRRSCCLRYRARDLGYCGDCVLG
jgi:FhuF 2Fe-2S C-terminal domain